jgi:hypothetical protein
VQCISSIMVLNVITTKLVMPDNRLAPCPQLELVEDYVGD